MLKLRIKEVGTAVPPPNQTPGRRVEIWRDNAGAIYAYGEILGDKCSMHVPGIASFHFTRNGDEVAAAITNGVGEELVQDAYRRRVLPMALQVRGREILHASAVSSPAGVMALCGASQVGKSTIAFGLSRRGYSLWGDDVLAFEISDGHATAFSLPFEIRLRPSAAEFFGREAVAASAAAGTAEDLPGVETVPIASLCVLSRADDSAGPVIVRRLPFAEAFSTILGHACWFTIHDSEGKRRVIDHYLDLAARTPIFDVAFKPGFENLPAVLDAIEQVLQENGQAPSTSASRH
jgi:hypothetical protein